MANVVLEVHTTLDPALASSVHDLIVGGFETDTVYEVDSTGHGFSLSERRVNPPLRKHYPMPDAFEDELPWDAVITAAVGQHPVAIAATTFSLWNRRQVLNELHVDPDWRRRGLARRLVAAVREEAARNRAREVWLETQNVNFPAIGVYRRLGFEMTGLDTTFYAYDGPGNAEVAIFMSMPLDH